MNWLEVSLTVNGELAEAVADVLARFAPNGVMTEQGVKFINDEDEGTATGPITVRAYLPVDEHIEETRQKLIGQGVQPDRVKAFGIPTNSRFQKPVDKAAVIKALGLKPDLPKILVMGGSLGLGPMKSVIRKLTRSLAHDLPAAEAGRTRLTPISALSATVSNYWR